MKNYNIIKAAAISELMEKIAQPALYTIPKSTQPNEAPEPRVPNIFGKTKIERGESPREAQLFENQINPLFGDDRPIRADQILRDAAQPVAPRNLAGKTPAARGQAPRIPNASVVTPDNMDDIAQQAREVSPVYAQRMMSQGKDPVVPANASYAVNPSLGNTGAPARAIPVGPVAPPAAPVKVAPNFNALFKQQHASSFDPNSAMDRAKMQKLKARYGA